MLFNRFSLCIMVVRCFVLAAVAAFFVLKSNLNAKTKENIPFSILLAVCEYGSCAVHGFRAVEPEFSMHFQCDLFPLSKTKSVHNYFFRFCMCSIVFQNDMFAVKQNVCWDFSFKMIFFSFWTSYLVDFHWR